MTVIILSISTHRLRGDPWSLGKGAQSCRETPLAKTRELLINRTNLVGNERAALEKALAVPLNLAMLCRLILEHFVNKSGSYRWQTVGRLLKKKKKKRAIMKSEGPRGEAWKNQRHERQLGDQCGNCEFFFFFSLFLLLKNILPRCVCLVRKDESSLCRQTTFTMKSERQVSKSNEKWHVAVTLIKLQIISDRSSLLECGGKNNT